ncbi:MAG: DivIVA domain-containing protein [Aeromicrobium erythreum]
MKFREGYDVDEVDDFLLAVERRLTGRPDSALAHDIASVRFTPRRLRGGYDMGEVDAYLDELHRRAETGR